MLDVCYRKKLGVQGQIGVVLRLVDCYYNIIIGKYRWILHITQRTTFVFLSENLDWAQSVTYSNKYLGTLIIIVRSLEHYKQPLRGTAHIVTYSKKTFTNLLALQLVSCSDSALP